MPGIPLAKLFPFLLAMYFPFLVLICLVMVWLIGYAGLHVPLVGAVLGLSLLHFVVAALALRRVQVGEDAMELRLPRQGLQAVYDLVAEVARERRLAAPQEIRVAADTIAHVYEDEAGHAILVLGGLAVATLTQEALAGVSPMNWPTLPRETQNCRAVALSVR
jgi:hypothetical protein